MIDALVLHWSAFHAFCEAMEPVPQLRLGGGRRKGGEPKRAALLEELTMEVRSPQQPDLTDLPAVRQAGSSTHPRPDHLIRPGFVKWTWEDAAFVLRETRFSGQTRDLQVSGQQHITVLAEMMRRGLWRPYDKLDFAVLPDGKYVTVNGHHRLRAQAEAKRDIEWTIVVHRCSSLEEVAALYHVFDTNVRIRTEHQIIGASGVVDSLGLSRTSATALMRAVGLISAGLDVARDKRDLTTRIFDLRFAIAEEYGEAARLLEKCFDQADWVLRKRLQRPGTYSVALVTMKHQPKKAESFWGSVAQNDGLQKGDPRHTFVKTILGSDAGSTSWLPMAWAAAAWNAWLKGEKPGHFVPGDPRPVRVMATPFDRGRK